MKIHHVLFMASLMTMLICPIAMAEPPLSLEDLDAETIRVMAADPELYGFGTTAEFSTISSFEFVSNNSASSIVYHGNGYRRMSNTGTVSYHKAPVGAGTDIPLGALVGGVCVYVYDGVDDGEIKFNFARYELAVNTSGSPDYENLGGTERTGLTWDNGYTSLCSAPLHRITTWDDVDSDGKSGRVAYTINLEINGGGAALRYGGASILWQRQVAAAPATASFNDVGTGHWAFRHVEALADSGISTGCGGGSFCPNANVTRAEMAIFLAKALGLNFVQ